MALKSSNGRQKHHTQTQTGLHVLLRTGTLALALALGGAGIRDIAHGGAGAGNHPCEGSGTSGGCGAALHGTMCDGGGL
jgi:hypothetical protein